MSGFLPLDTDRLRVRRLGISDAPAFWAYKRLPEAVRFQCWRPRSLDEVQEFILDTESVEPNTPDAWLQLAVCRKDTGVMVGDVGLHFMADDPSFAEIGYTVSPEHQGKGYATEAVRAALGCLFGTLGKCRVTASVDPRNASSIKVLEKLGFRLEARFDKSLFLNGEWVDDCVYAMRKEEWEK